MDPPVRFWSQVGIFSETFLTTWHCGPPPPQSTTPISSPPLLSHHQTLPSHHHHSHVATTTPISPSNTTISSLPLPSITTAPVSSPRLSSHHQHSSLITNSPISKTTTNKNKTTKTPIPLTELSPDPPPQPLNLRSLVFRFFSFWWLVPEKCIFYLCSESRSRWNVRVVSELWIAWHAYHAIVWTPVAVSSNFRLFWMSLAVSGERSMQSICWLFHALTARDRARDRAVTLFCRLRSLAEMPLCYSCCAQTHHQRLFTQWYMYLVILTRKNARFNIAKQSNRPASQSLNIQTHGENKYKTAQQ